VQEISITYTLALNHFTGKNQRQDRVGKSLPFIGLQAISKRTQPKPNLKSDRRWP